jgi:hypothetical protein
MNSRANTSTKRQPRKNTAQRREPAMKTTLRTLLAAATLFALLGTAAANGNRGLCDNFCLTIADAYYDGDLQIAAAMLFVAQPSSDTIEVLVGNVADAKYDGNQAAALEAVTGTTPMSITAFAGFDQDPFETLLDNIAGTYYDGDGEAAHLALAGSQPLGPIEALASLVWNVADIYYDQDVEAACAALYDMFESDAQMNRVIFVLAGR